MEARILCENYSVRIGPLWVLKNRKANDSKCGPHMQSNGIAFINVIFIWCIQKVVASKDVEGSLEGSRP